MNPKQYTIGQLAKFANINLETIRYYEKRGLIDQPTPLDGYRKYSNTHLSKLKFIKRSKDLGFTLAEIKELLNYKINSNSKCRDVAKRAESKLIEIDEKIKNLKKLKKSLKGLFESCSKNEKSANECPILEYFEED